MGKKWIVVLVAAMLGLAPTVAQAGKYMVVVISAEDGDVVNVYDADTMTTLDNVTTIVGKKASGEAANKKVLSINKKGGPSKINKIPDHTVIHTKDSPGCVTYTYGNYSWEVCT